MKRGLGFILIIVVSVLVVFGIYFLARFSEGNISRDKLIEGTSLNLEPNNPVKLDFGFEEHYLNVDFIGDDFVDITLESNPIKIEGLKIGEARDIDLDNDGVADLRIELIEINNGKAKIEVQEIGLDGCVEDWKCNGWEECVGGVQNRACFDFGKCGTNLNKPVVERNCSGENEIAEGDSNGNTSSNTDNSLDSSVEEGCIENWICTSWGGCSSQGVQTRNCSDENNCGTLDKKPLDSRLCVSEEDCEGEGCSEFEYCSIFGCKKLECEEYEGASQCGQYQYCEGKVIEELTVVYDCCDGSCEYGEMTNLDTCEQNCIDEGYSRGQCSTPQNKLCSSEDPGAYYFVPNSGEIPASCNYELPGKAVITFPCCCS